MNWNQQNTKLLKDPKTKKRILKELAKNRLSPVSGNEAYWDRISHQIDYQKHPDKYVIGRGQQGVLSTFPYTSEMTPYWRFKTPEEAAQSADIIYWMFECYLMQNDFVGADIAKKFLHMGFTRARRYANHPSGQKYIASGKIAQQAEDALTSDKAISASIFKDYWVAARTDEKYLALKKEWGKVRSK